MSRVYSVPEIDRRCQELGERERAKGAGHDTTVTVRFVEPRPVKGKRRRRKPVPAYESWRRSDAA